MLETYPLDFNINSNTVFVKHPHSGFETGDLITMTNVFGEVFNLRTFDDNGVPSFVIPPGCNIMKITLPVPHNLNDYNGDIIEVEISGVMGDRGSVDTASFLGNLQTNLINTTHDVVINVDPASLDPNCVLPPDFLNVTDFDIFVILALPMHNVIPPYNLGDYTYTVKFLAVAGVPLNLLNARYPIDPEHRQGFHVVRNVFDNGYTIDLDVNALIDENGGGNCVTVSKIVSLQTGYPNPNNYTIGLGENYNNIVSVKMLSCEFPNSDTAIRDFPAERANNKIYWNDIDDGEFLYSIEVPAGNYNTNDLISTMENLFIQVPRQNAGADIGATYKPNHFIRVGVNVNTNEVIFDSFKEFCLIQPIVDVDPDISQDPASADKEAEANAQYTLTINHPGHGMVNPGEVILISGAISHLGIPADVINGEHVVSEIIDENNYKITFPECSFNLSDSRPDTKGGAAVTILVPDLFRLRFDQPDTLGSVLGFRNPGDPNSIFPFQQKISNKDRYEFDSDTNELGETIIIDNNAIQLSGNDYVMMVAEPLESMKNIGPVKSVFAKILLCDLPGKVLFNTHVNTPIYYVDPFHQLDELKIQFYTQNGFLYDFNGLDHSFLLEIITVNDIPEGSGINANTGKNYNMRV
jgi:hypothetical protein